MDRRGSLKLIATGLLTAPGILAGCSNEEKKQAIENFTFNLDRNPDELKYERELLKKEDFFTEQEMETITVLCDIIIPADEISGSASDAGVPAFIAFIVKDMPDHQLPLRGGLRWLEMQCLKRFGRSFTTCTDKEKLEMIDLIAYPERAKGNPELQPGVSFFNLLRNLTATGFYTSEIGVKDIGYAGNQPNQWNGVPEEVLAQYKLSYSEKELRESIGFDKNQ